MAERGVGLESRWDNARPLRRARRGVTSRALPLCLAIGGLAAACRPALPLADAADPASPTVEYTRRQETLSELPVRVRLPSRYGADRVLVFYRTWGSPEWDSVELARRGQTWSGAVSCRDVSTVTGDTHYYFMVLDSAGREIPGSGWRKWQHVVTVVGELSAGPQALDGERAAPKCHDPADCPPDFPGCPAYSLRRPACRSSADCADGRRCDWDGYCASTDAVPTEVAPTDEELLATAIRKATGPQAAR